MYSSQYSGNASAGGLIEDCFIDATAALSSSSKHSNYYDRSFFCVLLRVVATLAKIGTKRLKTLQTPKKAQILVCLVRFSRFTTVSDVYCARSGRPVGVIWPGGLSSPQTIRIYSGLEQLRPRTVVVVRTRLLRYCLTRISRRR